MRLALVLFVFSLLPQAAEAHKARQFVKNVVAKAGDRIKGNRLQQRGDVATLRLGKLDLRATQMANGILYSFQQQFGFQSKPERQAIKAGLNDVVALFGKARRFEPTRARLTFGMRETELRAWHEGRGIEIKVAPESSSVETRNARGGTLIRQGDIVGPLVAYEAKNLPINRNIAGDLGQSVLLRFEATSKKAGSYGQGLIRLLDRKGATLTTLAGTSADYDRLLARLGPAALSERMAAQ